jgi:hypothetical protein
MDCRGPLFLHLEDSDQCLMDERRQPAFERVVKAKVKYRFVIDMASLDRA